MKLFIEINKNKQFWVISLFVLSIERAAFQAPPRKPQTAPTTRFKNNTAASNNINMMRK